MGSGAAGAGGGPPAPPPPRPPPPPMPSGGSQMNPSIGQENAHFGRYALPVFDWR